MNRIKQGLCFDDVLLEPQYSDIHSRKEVSTSVKLGSMTTLKIPIVSKSHIKDKPDCALVLAWNFINEIKKKNSNLANKFISIKDLEI